MRNVEGESYFYKWQREKTDNGRRDEEKMRRKRLALNELWHFMDHIVDIYRSTLSKTREWGSCASWRHTEVQAPATRSGFSSVMAMDKNISFSFSLPRKISSLNVDALSLKQDQRRKSTVAITYDTSYLGGRGCESLALVEPSIALVPFAARSFEFHFMYTGTLRNRLPFHVHHGSLG